jgi:hypothetical protein
MPIHTADQSGVDVGAPNPAYTSPVIWLAADSAGDLRIQGARFKSVVRSCRYPPRRSTSESARPFP